MTPHPNLTKALLVLGLTASISMLPAQTPASGQSTNPDRQSTRSGSDTTDRNTRSTTSQSGARTTASGDQTQAAGAEQMVGPGDLKFMNEAAQGGLMEVQIATLAQEKAQSEEVKKFAQELQQDHSKANEELKALAEQKNVSLPSEMTPKDQAKISKLQAMSGEQFDREFMKMQVDHHKKDVKAFEKQSERAMDSHVKAFASKTLPTLQQHLQTAQGLQTSTRSRKADTSSDRATPDPSDSRTPSPDRNPSIDRDPAVRNPADRNPGLDRPRPTDDPTRKP
jgi:putative membrane protein